MSQEYRKDEIEMVSINSVYMNKNQSKNITDGIKLKMYSKTVITQL